MSCNQGAQSDTSSKVWNTISRMPGVNRSLQCLCFLGFLLCISHAWHISMPSKVKGLLHSCLVIPCSFDYDRYPPRNPSRVVWYQYAWARYPLVYDPWYAGSVIDKFKGRTSRAYIHNNGKECSLYIYPVTYSHHQEVIYPWIDPEHVGKSTYRFFDKTVTIEVMGSATKPHIMITGSMKVGGTVTVTCSVEHTCPTMPPTVRLNMPLETQRVTQSFKPDGTSRTTLTATMIIKNDHQIVQCTAQHEGGLKAMAFEQLNADCVFMPLTIKAPSEFNEGQRTKVTCTALYTCAKHTPTITWNRDSLQISTNILKERNTQMKYVSTLTFIASAKDSGKSLTCNAQFSNGYSQGKSVTLLVRRNMLSLDWSFTTPRSITGMRGSCIIIPCQFTYTVTQPVDLRVKWYSLQGNGYQPVHDEAKYAINTLGSKTSIVGSVTMGNCSLKIYELKMSHNQQRLYPWVDKNPINSYYNDGQNFNDKTTQLIVSDSANKPQLSIGIPRVGEQSNVTCSIQHTCESSPPTLTISGIVGADKTFSTQLSDTMWESKVERMWTVQEEDQSVECTVRYPGGPESTSMVKLNAECPYQKITMTEPPSDVTEGRAKSVICSVLYKCKKNLKTIEWNYKDLQSSSSTKEFSNQTYQTVSNLTFIGSLEDNGKSLTCTAQFLSGTTSNSSTITVKKYERPFEQQFYGDSDTGVIHSLVADVPYRFPALTRSCVLIPCSFQSSDILSRGMWSKINGGLIYHNGKSYMLNHFKDRTKMPQDLGKGDCSLEIDDIKPFDSGPFCFHGEKGNDKYRFNNSCVFIVMKASPEKPVMSQVPKEVFAGSMINVSCSVTHTCASHPPEFSWSVPNLTNEVEHTMMSRGVWKITSMITFMADGGDGVKHLTCTATFWRGKQQASTVTLTVKGTLTHKMRTSQHISVPVIIGIIVAAVCAGVICKKRKNLQRPPPRPEKRRSLMERLTGLSRRYRERSDRPPRPEKRRSLWKRFSRAESRVNWQNDRKPRYHDNVSVEYMNNASTVNFNHHTSK